MLKKYVRGFYFYKFLAEILVIGNCLSFSIEGGNDAQVIFWCVLGFITSVVTIFTIRSFFIANKVLNDAIIEEVFGRDDEDDEDEDEFGASEDDEDDFSDDDDDNIDEDIL